MQTSLATVCLSGSLSDTVRPAVEADPDHVELFESDSLSFGGEREDVDAPVEGLTPDSGASAPLFRLVAQQRFLRETMH